MIFIADLIACLTCFGHHYVHHQELESIIQVVAACRIWGFGFQVVGMVWSWGLCVRFAGCCSSPQTGHITLMMGIVVPEIWWASNKICNKNHLLHLVGILFPHIWKFLWGWLDRNSRVLMVVKNDCSAVQIVFVSGIAWSEERHQAFTAKLPHCMLKCSFDNAEDLKWYALTDDIVIHGLYSMPDESYQCSV